LIFALTSTTDGVRRNTAQPFGLQEKTLFCKVLKRNFFPIKT
jgi:hypothetical protein